MDTQKDEEILKASTKISNLRRELVNEYSIPEELQMKFIDLQNEVKLLEANAHSK
jgi:hypothetical protein